MDRCLAAFCAWVENHVKISWDAVTQDAQALATALRAYGIHCFESGLPRYMFVYSITAVQDQFPMVKNFTNVAWQVDKKWQQYEPGSCRPVLPSVVIRAIICLSTLWGWHSLTGIVVLGFAAMLHPSEMLSLTRRDLVFPRDLGFDNASLYVHLKNPKTSRFARRQHGRIDDPVIVAIAERLFGSLELDERLFKAPMGVFRKQWNLLLDRLGIPFRKVDKGATPAVLRGSGATHLYTGCEDIAWIAWRGRWAHTHTGILPSGSGGSNIDPSAASLCTSQSSFLGAICFCSSLSRAELAVQYVSSGKGRGFWMVAFSVFHTPMSRMDFRTLVWQKFHAHHRQRTWEALNSAGGKDATLSLTTDLTFMLKEIFLLAQSHPPGKGRGFWMVAFSVFHTPMSCMDFRTLVWQKFHAHHRQRTWEALNSAGGKDATLSLTTDLTFMLKEIFLLAQSHPPGKGRGFWMVAFSVFHTPMSCMDFRTLVWQKFHAHHRQRTWEALNSAGGKDATLSLTTDLTFMLKEIFLLAQSHPPGKGRGFWMVAFSVFHTPMSCMDFRTLVWQKFHAHHRQRTWEALNSAGGKDIYIYIYTYNIVLKFLRKLCGTAHLGAWQSTAKAAAL